MIACIYNNNEDCIAAANIVYNEFVSPFDNNRMNFNNFISYTYGEVGIPDHLLETEDKNNILYAIGIPYNKYTKEAFEKLYYEKGYHIVYITNTKENEKIDDHVGWVYFHNNEFSCSMLVYIYSYMNNEERIHPMDIWFDFNEDMTHFKVRSEKETEIRIPPIIRFMNDFNTLRFEDTNYFRNGICCDMDVMSHPSSDMLKKLIYDNSANMHKVRAYIDSGEMIDKYVGYIGYDLMINTKSTLSDGVFKLDTLNRISYDGIIRNLFKLPYINYVINTFPGVNSKIGIVYSKNKDKYENIDQMFESGEYVNDYTYIGILK